MSVLDNLASYWGNGDQAASIAPAEPEATVPDTGPATSYGTAYGNVDGQPTDDTGNQYEAPSAPSTPVGASTPTTPSGIPAGTPAKPIATVDTAANQFSPSQFNLGSDARQIAWPNPERLAITLYNFGANVITIGSNAGNCADGIGFPIPGGGTLTIAVTGQIWARSDSGSIVALLEFTHI